MQRNRLFLIGSIYQRDPHSNAYSTPEKEDTKPNQILVWVTRSTYTIFAEAAAIKRMFYFSYE